jgi:hypothetical protein
MPLQRKSAHEGEDDEVLIDADVTSTVMQQYIAGNCTCTRY